MIKRLAENMAHYYVRKNIIAADESEVYSYGLELVISSALSLILVFTVAAVLGIIVEAAAFVLSFILLRAFGGGYHAKTHKGCIWTFFTVFIIFSYTIRYLPLNIAPIYVLSGAVISSIIIWIAAPVEAKNKPLSAEKRTRLKKQCCVIACIYMIIAILSYVYPNAYGHVFVFTISGELAASVSMGIAAKIQTEN